MEEGVSGRREDGPGKSRQVSRRRAAGGEGEVLAGRECHLASRYVCY